MAVKADRWREAAFGRRAPAVAAFGLAVWPSLVPACAADLPSKAAAPQASYLAICNVGGMAGFTIPGTATCLKIGGYVDVGLAEGNISKQYGLQFEGVPGSSPVTSADTTAFSNRDSFGTLGHVQLSFDARTNTAYGPLRAYAEFQANRTSGFEATADGMALNVGYFQWAGFTGGKVGSFFSYLAGGPSWYDFYSPDRFNGNQPTLIGYTANFGSLSASVSIEDTIGARVNGSINGGFTNQYFGTKYPDLVAAVRTEQTWGSAQISGVLHNTHVLGVSNDEGNFWGGAALLGVTYNLPGQTGDRIAAQAVVSHGALGYSGLSNTAWSPLDQGLNLNGNGTIFQLTDALNYDTGQWSIPTAWSVAALYHHYFSPQFSVAPEVSFASVTYSGSPAMISAHATSVIVGGTAYYNPVPHLGFQLGIIYQRTHQDVPAGYDPAGAPFHANSSGVAATLQIVRDF